MQITFISYFLASIIAYLGLLLGVILIKLSPEEQKPGKKYFILLKQILFVLILIPLLYYFKINLILSVVLLSIVIALIIKRKVKFERNTIIYFILGIIFYLSSRIPDLLIIESVLIFLYGIPTSSLILKKNNYLKIFFNNLWFFIPIILLYFIL